MADLIYREDGGINENALATRVTLREGLDKSVSIAQVKEVQRILLEELAALPASKVLALIEGHGS